MYACVDFYKQSKAGEFTGEKENCCFNIVGIM